MVSQLARESAGEDRYSNVNRVQAFRVDMVANLFLGASVFFEIVIDILIDFLSDFGR